MLQQRSILIEVCLLLAVCLAKAEYDYEGAEESSNLTEDADYEPDYTKYYSEASAPVASSETNPETSGYVVPAEFEQFYAPSHVFGESNEQSIKTSPADFNPQKKRQKEKLQTFESKKQEFPSYHPSGPLRDFFEESHKKQQLDEQQSRDEEVIRPGPSYISHQVPARFNYDEDEEKSAESTDEDVERVPPRANKPRNDYSKDFEEGTVDKDTDGYKIADYSFDSKALKNSKQPVDYNTGKSSSTVSQYPTAAGYNKGSASTPYEKYSFQPPKEDYRKDDYPKEAYPKEDYAAETSKFFDTLLSTAAPYEPDYKKIAEHFESQSTEDVPSQLKGKGCRKVSPSKSDDMNCFVCENPKTNAKYTQCSYSSQKEPVNHYEGTSSTFSLPHRVNPEPSSYRYKRYAENDDDPYTRIRSRSRKATEELGIPSDYALGFQYEADHYGESRPDYTYSEQQTEELKKNPENCKKVDKDGMTCTICKNPKTGGNFEQCSYTSAPQEKKYAYVTEKKYDNDEPLESQVVPQTEKLELVEDSKPKKSSSKNTEAIEDYESRINQEKSPRKRNEEGHGDYDAKSSDKKPIDSENYDVPSHFISSLSSPHKDGSESAESVDSTSRVPKADFSDFDEYHFKYFPEFAKQESRQENVQEKYQIPIPEQTKQNVESVLAEFSKKDRSNCKKAEKKGMTCYLCVDKNNIQNEECMYVQESRPKSTHVAYHEMKATEKAKIPDTSSEKIKPEESIEQPVAAESIRKYFFVKAATPTPLMGLETAASEEVGTYVRYDPEEAVSPKRKRSSKPTKEPKDLSPQEEIEELIRYNLEEGHEKFKRSDLHRQDTKEASPSEEIKDFVRYDVDEEFKSHKKGSQDSKEPKPDASAYDSERIDDKADPTIKTPSEFNVAAEEGAFSDETKSVYSNALGIKLPKYMLEKSEFEKEFDDFAGSY